MSDSTWLDPASLVQSMLAVQRGKCVLPPVQWSSDVIDNNLLSKFTVSSAYFGKSMHEHRDG